MAANAMRNYYRALEIPYDSPYEVVKQAYRDLVRVWHPDRFVRDERLQKLATEKLVHINEAYRVLRSYTFQDREKNGKDARRASSPVHPPADPIDWSRTSHTETGRKSTITHAKAFGQQRYYAVVGVPVAGLVALLVTGLFFQKAGEIETLPPPLYQESNAPSTHLPPATQEDQTAPTDATSSHRPAVENPEQGSAFPMPLSSNKPDG